MATSVKNNIVHRVLGILSSEEREFWTAQEIVKKMDRWYKKYSIHEINYAIRVLYKDGKEIFEQSDGSWCIPSPFLLNELRESYSIQEYKKEVPWWTWPARILSALVGFATIIGVVDNMQSPDLKRRIEKQQLELKSAQDKTIRDSIILQSLYDSIDDLQKFVPDSLDNNLKVKK